MPSADINGFRIHYERGGQGPLLAMLHGVSTNARSWQHQLQELADAYDVVAWDMRGYGSSSDPEAPYSMADLAADLAGLLDHLGVQAAHLCGLAMGGVLALDFYGRFPQRVRSLILADTGPGQAVTSEEERQQGLELRQAAAVDTSPARLKTPMLLSAEAPQRVVAEVESIMAEMHPEGYRFAAQAYAQTDEREVLPRVDVPTLVLWGECDTVCPREDAEYLARTIKGARLEVIPRAGHLVNQENPEAFNDAVRRFLADLP